MSKGKKHSRVAIGRGSLGRRFVYFQDLPDLRPTPSRVRDAVFSMLREYAETHGFIDACAGSGVMGFEAASMGFEPVIMLDNNITAQEDLQENRQTLKAPVDIRKDSALKLDRLKVDKQSWIVYADPPFRIANFHDKILRRLVEAPYLGEDCLYIAEHESERSWPEQLEMVKEKRYGRTRITILRLTPESVES